MEESFWKTSFFVLFLVWFSIRILFGIGTLKNKTKQKKSNLLDKFLVLLNFAGTGGLAVYVVFNFKLDFAAMNLPSYARWAALVIYTLNIGLFAWCHKSLGSNWSGTLEIQKYHTLIQEGPYKRIRHPMYTHFWILVISQGALLNNWIVLIYGVLAWGILYFYRVNKEERMMTDEFCSEYIQYMERTGRLLPKFK